MKKSIVVMCFLGLSLIPTLVQALEKPIWQGIGRIALSSDGNEHDDDDWSASAFSLAMLYASNTMSHLSLYTYSDHVWGSNHAHPARATKASAYDQMKTSVLGARTYFGMKNVKLICAVDDPEKAYNAMRDEINRSTADDPLTIIAAGPMQVVGEAMCRADKDRLQYVTIISHSKWNNEHADRSVSTVHPLDKKYMWDNHKGWTWNEMKLAFEAPQIGGQVIAGVHFILIEDQNEGSDKIGLYASRSFFDWVKTTTARQNKVYKEGTFDWLWNRLNSCIKNKGQRYDISDAGMIVYFLTGNQKVNPTDVQEILEHPVSPHTY